jgi:signal transduction histidine kinase
MSATDFLAVHPDPVIQYGHTDDGMVVRRVNSAFEETFGVDASADAPVSLPETLVSTDDVDAVAAAIESGEAIDRTVECPATDGDVSVRLRHVPADDGGYLVYTDVTDSATRERELERRNEQLETFASVVSHDLRNPIEVAETYLNAAAQDGDPEHFERVESALTTMRTLIEDVLALAREGQVIDATERVSLAEVATDAWAAVDTADADLSVATDTATLQADADRFVQLLGNLYRNAVEHAGEDVTVTVDVVGDGDGSGWFVADDGPGIDPDEREDVLEPGVTTATDGTGLGLSIVERIADAHGWSLSVTESDAGGARFEFTDVESLQPF